MTTKILALLVMLLLSASLAGAAVCEDETDATGGYTVTPAKDAGGDAGILWIYDTITQGETNWHSKIVSTNINTLIVDLNWGDTTDSLRLKIHTLTNSNPMARSPQLQWANSQGCLRIRLH